MGFSRSPLTCLPLKLAVMRDIMNRGVQGFENMPPPLLVGATLISLFCTPFNRGVFVEWFWKFSGHIYIWKIWTMKRCRLSAAEMADFSTISSRPG